MIRPIPKYKVGDLVTPISKSKYGSLNIFKKECKRYCVSIDDPFNIEYVRYNSIYKRHIYGLRVGTLNWDFMDVDLILHNDYTLEDDLFEI
jgi:hypothetical protein